jgi:Zn-dependent protease
MFSRITELFTDIPGTLLRLIVVVLALSVHEMAHGYAAYKLGDSTARNFGRLSLNPIRHIDPVGFICMLLFGFGWAKPVPINARNFKNPRRGMAISAFAGPLSNILLFLIGHLIYWVILFLGVKGILPVGDIFVRGGIIYYSSLDFGFGMKMFLLVLEFFQTFAILNLSLGIFNLIPVPPLDGSRILYIFLPPKYYFGVMKYEQYIQFGLFALLFLTDIVTNALGTVCMSIINGTDSLFNLIFRLY